jgi:hypothetical protein
VFIIGLRCCFSLIHASCFEPDPFKGVSGPSLVGKMAKPGKILKYDFSFLVDRHQVWVLEGSAAGIFECIFEVWSAPAAPKGLLPSGARNAPRLLGPPGPARPQI